MKKILLFCLFIFSISTFGCSTISNDRQEWISNEIYQQRQQLIKKFNPFTEKEVLGLWRAVWQHMNYHRDENGDVWQTPEHSYRIKKGDCEDFNLLLASCLYAEGYDVAIAVGSSIYDKYEVNHAWVLLRVDGREYFLDATRHPPIDLEEMNRMKPESKRYTIVYLVEPFTEI